MATIKNIIFDLGGVLLNLDIHKTEKAFIDLGFTDFHSMYNQHAANELFAALETGSVSADEFFYTLTNVAGKPFTEQELTNAWNAMLLDFRLKSLQYLPGLKENYSLYLLSNTNAIHYSAFNKILKEETGHSTLDDFFTKAYFSHHIGLRKPNAAIFEYVLKDAQITAEETLFIDDTQVNINAAKNLGMHSHLLLPGEFIEQIPFQSLLV